MTEFESEQAFLDRTMRKLMGAEYDGYQVVFRGYHNLGKNTYGRCMYTNRTRCDIALGKKYPWDSRPLFREAVLYHEACHAKLFLEDGKGNGHDAEFRKLRRANKKYWIADIIMKLLWCTK